jgi:hypothetical protein
LVVEAAPEQASRHQQQEWQGVTPDLAPVVADAAQAKRRREIVTELGVGAGQGSDPEHEAERCQQPDSHHGDGQRDERMPSLPPPEIAPNRSSYEVQAQAGQQDHRQLVGEQRQQETEPRHHLPARLVAPEAPVAGVRRQREQQ